MYARAIVGLLALLGLPLLPTSGREAHHPSGRWAGADGSVQYWYEEAQRALEARLRQREPRGEARNVVMFLGDGMSVPTLAAARTLLGQRRGRPGEETQLFFESFPTVGLAKTYCVDAQVADSACTATAYLCGSKANYGTIGVSDAVRRRRCRPPAAAERVASVAAWALAAGKDAGLVTTARVTHASPAGVYAHVADRDWESDADVAADCAGRGRPEDIARQLVLRHPGDQLKVILGGGRREFLPDTVEDEEGTKGKRLDKRNLIEEWIADKVSRNVSHEYIWNREQLMNISSSPPEYLLGLFEGSHMQYNLEANTATEPTLSELVEVAIRSLSRNPRGFFLFVEGGRIDHAHHDNLPMLALDETLAMDAAVQRAASLLPAHESLLVVTADHAHVMAFNGYARRGADVLGPSDDRDELGVPYMTLSYTNGPGARRQDQGRRPDVTQDEDFQELRWVTHADVPLDSETHGGDDVAVFARGPHHRMFTGLYEQSQLPHLMAYAACIGPGKHACDSGQQ